MSASRTGGFTLIEIMIALAILAILVTIAYPSYLDQVRKSRRSDGQQALLDLANRMEKYFTEYNTYATATVATGNATDVLSSSDSSGGYYTLSITAQTATSYTIQAAPKAGGPQVGDTKCANLTLTSTGLKDKSGTESVGYCWGT